MPAVDRSALADRIIERVGIIAEREGLSGEAVLDKLTTFGEWLGRNPEAALAEAARVYYVDLAKLATTYKRLPAPKGKKNG